MRYLICVVAIFLILSGSIRAQSPNAALNGQVVDSSGGVIVGANIDAVNVATNVRYSTKTNAEGMYLLPGLPPANYEIQVSHAGFKTILKPDVLLNVQDAVVINFVLPLGAVSERVTVEAGASMINTTNASVSTVVDQTYIKNMPLNGRSFQDLILLTPGVVTQSPQVGSAIGASGEFSVNGQRTESNYYTVDGVSANVGAATDFNMTSGGGASGSVGAATALGTTQALVSVDALQEFRVQSSTYSAEYGRNPGGQFAFETKSGTNQWHGTAYDYLRNDYFDANDWFTDYFRASNPALTKPATRQNDFGGTLGGPVRIPGLYNGKDKTFFFVSYEGLRLVQPQPTTATLVPDLCMRGSSSACASLNAQYAGTPAGSAIGYPSNGRSPAASAMLPVINAFPMPSPSGLEDATNGFGQFIGSWSNPSSIDSTSIRLDHNLSEKVRLFFRFSNTTSNSAMRLGGTSGLVPSVETISAYTTRTFTGGVSSALASHLTNEFRLNYSSNVATADQEIDTFGGSTPANLRKLLGLGPNSFPIFDLSYVANDVSLQESKPSGAQKQWNLVDAVSFSFGRHQINFGADYRRLAPSAAQSTPQVDYFYFGESDVEQNNAFPFPAVFGPAYPLYKNFSAFAQDEWRVAPRLSLSLGLRWDVNPPPGVTRGVKPYTIQGSSPDTWALAAQGTPLWKTTWYNFAPRLGAAYVLRNTPGWEMVVRSGGGVFFDTGQQEGSQSFGGPGFVAFGHFLPGSFPVLPAIPALVNPPEPPFIFDPVGFAKHLQLPYTLQWNASIEQALGKSQALTVSYVGSHAARLLQQNNFHSSNNKNTSNFIFIENGLTSDYDSLQVQFQRRFSRGLTALASYAWSHCMDYGSENSNFGYRRGNCDFDVRNNLSAAFSYDVPNVGHGSFVNAVLHHWGLDDRFTARTAFPVTLQGNRFFDPATGKQYASGLDLVPGQPVYLYGANCASVLHGLGDLQTGQGCPGGRAINPQAFTNVSSGFGDAPRNFVSGFGAWQMDLAVRREFPIYENLKLQFRAETFNIFNHPNFGLINASFGQSTFGQATATLASSLHTLNPLYQQGGPRSMQFALKLIF